MAAARTEPGIVVPRPDAVVMHAPLRVVVRPPAGARGLRVELGSRDVTRRFHRDGGGRLVGVLTSRQGLRHGWNELTLLTGRRRNPSVVEASSFTFVRRASSLARLTLRPGPITLLTVRRSDPTQIPMVRAWLNGHSITRAIDTSNPERLRAELSVNQGLRDGTNDLRLLVIEPPRGRYVEFRRRFSLPRSTELPGAGWDMHTIVGTRVSLDGGASHAPRGRALMYRWHLRSKPPGSRARLRKANSRRPVLVPDQPGDYVVGLQVAPSSGGALSKEDSVDVSASPDRYLVRFSGDTIKDGKHGIQVGDTFYPNPSPDGSLQYLTLDRSTLEPAENTYGNSYLDGSQASIGRLAGQLENGNTEQLVVLSYPAPRDKPAVQPSEIPAFKAALGRLGIDLRAKNDAQINSALRGQFTVVGIPWSGTGSGFLVKTVFFAPLKGWLMPGATAGADGPLFRLQPMSPAFNTSLAHDSRSNTMIFAGKEVRSSLPQGCTGGFQVEQFNPTTVLPLTVPYVFCVNGGADPAGEMARMEDWLPRGPDPWEVVIQSIGTVAAPPPFTGPPENRKNIPWYRLGAALARFGANPDTFNKVKGSYAFVGGLQLDPSEVADSSSAVTEGPPESGTLQGELTLGHDGVVAPIAADATGTADFPLLHIALQDPQPWPFTKGYRAPGFTDADVPAYADALAYVTQKLSGGVYSKWGNGRNLREAYAGNLNLNWLSAKTDLHDLPYPGDGKLCNGELPGQGAPNPPAKPPIYTRAQFCNLTSELQKEFTWLEGIKNNLFEPYQKVFDVSVVGQDKDLESIGAKIRESLEHGDDAAEIAWSIGQFLTEMTAALVPEAKAAKLAAEALVAAYKLAREMVDVNYSNKLVPVSDTINTKVIDLGRELAERMKASSNAMDGIRQVIVSDYGRLAALGAEAFGPDWKVSTGKLREYLDNTARASFSNALVPVAYGVHALESSSRPSELQNPVACGATFKGHPFKDAAPSSAINWMGNFSRDGYVGWWPTKLILGIHERIKSGTQAGIEASLSNDMFRPLSRNGYGMQLSRFIWQQYGDVPPHPATGTPGPPTDIFVCSG